mmetsp:Transcript_130579/g.325820  ORF Transcript_130579/g.325820 Transcript_130579/m.325820 type:complete len:204 (-) Transcript_130579:177-788(-)
MLGLSTNFKDFTRQFDMQAVTLSTASRSWALSPMERMFLLRCPSTSEAKLRPISFPKARSFHSKGEGKSGRSYSDRAETSLTLSNKGPIAGRKRWQLNSIHPLSAFVTSTTVPNCLAKRKVSAARFDNSPNSCWCLTESGTSLSNLRPLSWTHELAMIVSSQSKISTVSSGMKRWPKSSSLSVSASAASASLSVAAQVVGLLP